MTDLQKKITELEDDIKYDGEVLLADLTSLEKLCQMHKKRVAANKPVEAILAGQVVQKIDARISALAVKNDLLKTLKGLIP